MNASMHGVADGGSSAVPAFLTKLWTLVEDPATNSLIEWDLSGRSFHVTDQGRFAKEVLPLYFKHNNIASFIRQLNMYGFRKIMSVEQGALKTEKDNMQFAHQYFLRDSPESLEFIKRKVTAVKTEDVKLKQDDVTRVLSDVRSMKGKQDNLSSKLDQIQRENEALWREVASLRQKHMKQQQIVNKLIQFLITLMGSNRPLHGMKRKMPLMINDANQLQVPPKVPKFSHQLSIDTSSTPYLSEGNESLGGLTIHDVTDVSPTVMEPVDGSRTLKPSSNHGNPAVTDSKNVPGMTCPVPVGYVPSSRSSLGLHRPNNSSMGPLRSLITSLATDGVPQESTGTLDGSSTWPLLDQQMGGPGDALDPSVLVGLQQSILETVAPTSPETSDPIISSPSPRTSELGEGPPLIPPSTVATVPASPSRNEISDHIDTLATELDSLKDLLSGNQYFDTGTLMGLFNPEVPLASKPDVNPFQMMPEVPLTLSSEQKPSTSANSNFITGNELIQYNPHEDLGSLFDMEMATSLDALDTLPSPMGQPHTDPTDDDLQTPATTPLVSMAHSPPSFEETS